MDIRDDNQSKWLPLLRCHRRILAMIRGPVFSGSFWGQTSALSGSSSSSSHMVCLLSVLHLLLLPRSADRNTLESWSAVRWKPLPWRVRWPFFEQLQAWPSSSPGLQARSPTLSCSWAWKAVKHLPVCGFLRVRLSELQRHSWRARPGLHSSRLKLLWPSCTCMHFPNCSFLMLNPATSMEGKEKSLGDQ